MNRDEFKIFKKRVKTKNTHGTGCTLKCNCNLFSMWKPRKSCELELNMLKAIKSNLNYGKGHSPINHLNSIKIKRKFLAMKNVVVVGLMG